MGGVGGLVSAGGGAAAVATGAAGAAANTAESAAFMTSMTAMQADANANQIGMATLANTKALADGLGKIIKTNGDSVKGVAPQ